MTSVEELTCELLNRCSVTPEDAGCLQLVLDYLGEDFDHEYFNFEDTKNLLISHGSGAPHLMFLGHIDVVPAGNESDWSSPPFSATKKDGKIFGRGACDMKSGVAAITIAVKDFVNLSASHSGTISILLTSDEEGSNKNAIPKVVEEFKKRGTKIDYCVVGEPTSSKALGDIIKVGRRGTLSGTLTVHGVQGHIAYPHLADNPIHSFAKVLAEVSQHKWDEGNEFFDPTSLQFSNIHSGSGATNVIPASLEAKFNFRFTPQQTPQSLMSEFENFLNVAGLKYEITWTLGGLPFLTEGGKLIESCKEAIKSQLNISPKLETGGGTSDGRFIAPLGTEVVEIGLRGESMHKVDEFVRVEDLEPLAKIYASIASKIL